MTDTPKAPGTTIQELTAPKVSFALTIVLGTGWFFFVLAKLVQISKATGSLPVELKTSLNPMPLLMFASVGEFAIAVALLTVAAHLLEPLYRGKALQTPQPEGYAKQSIKRGACISGGLCFALNLAVNPEFTRLFFLAVLPWIGVIAGAVFSAWKAGWRIVKLEQ